MIINWKLSVVPFLLLVPGTLHLGTVSPASAQQSQSAPATQVASPVASQTPPQGDEALLGTLPPELREAGAAVLREKDDDAKARLVRKLVKEANAPSGGSLVPPKDREFLIALVDAKQCPRNSSQCINLFTATLKEKPDPALRVALERWVSSHPDPEVSVTALKALLDVNGFELSRLLQERVDFARASGTEGAQQTLGHAQERLGWTNRGVAVLPGFFWDPPPVFSVAPDSASIRVRAISDFGKGPEVQQKAAEAMLMLHRAQPFDFGLTLGDNYQDDGAHSPTDSRWQEYWGRWYPQIGIPFYVTLGNHDWRSPDGPAAEILYSQKSPEWRFPAPYYTFTAGPVRFFAVS